ncbi:MAG: hypothetical protein R3C56_34430 [Pirellulaceae bacterium]
MVEALGNVAATLIPPPVAPGVQLLFDISHAWWQRQPWSLYPFGSASIVQEYLIEQLGVRRGNCWCGWAQNPTTETIDAAALRCGNCTTPAQFGGKWSSSDSACRQSTIGW